MYQYRHSFENTVFFPFVILSTTLEVNPIRDFDIKCLAKSLPVYVNVKVLLKSFLFDTAPGEGPTNLIKTNFSFASVTSGESASF